MARVRTCTASWPSVRLSSVPCSFMSDLSRQLAQVTAALQDLTLEVRRKGHNLAALRDLVESCLDYQLVTLLTLLPCTLLLALLPTLLLPPQQVSKLCPPDPLRPPPSSLSLKGARWLELLEVSSCTGRLAPRQLGPQPQPPCIPCARGCSRPQRPPFGAARYCEKQLQLGIAFSAGFLRCGRPS